MKSTLNRILVLLLSMLLSVVILSSCAQEITLMNFLQEGTEGLVLDDFICTIGMSIHSDSTGLVIDENNPFGYKENTDLADAVLERISDIEKAEGCDIVLSVLEDEWELLSVKLMADNVQQDVLYSPSHALMKHQAEAGYLEIVDEYSSYIDYKNTEKYGTANIQEMNAVNGHIYAVSPISWMYKQPRALELLVFNDDLMKKYATPDPKEFIENGTWNWDAFETVIAESSNADGDNSVYSLAARGMDVVKLLAYGNGVRLAYETENGYATDFGADNLIEAVQFYYDLREKYTDNFTPDMGDWPDIIEAFTVEQNSVACLTAASILYNDIVYEVQNYSVAPFPTGPKGEYGKWPSAIEATESFSVFYTALDPEADFAIIDMLCEPFTGFETEQDRFEYLSSNVVYTYEDAEYAMNTYKNGTYTYWTFSDNSDNGFDDLWRAGFAKGAIDGDDPRSIAVVLEELKDIYPALIEDYMVPNFPIYELID
ncbi:MAG: hypothetical protein IJE40_00765 [Clostridia bacterium]|nr:hypothetical protein [Clostridia bacterium]